MKYAVLVSCRNEEKHIGPTAKAILHQTVKPACVVIVDDDSSDRTAEIVSAMPGVTLLKKRYPRHPVRGVNLALALNAGLRKVTELVPDWEYLLKVDADSILPPKYVEKLSAKFRETRPGEDPLGISSGNPQDEKVWKGRASDGAKVFRRGCMDAIGGFPTSNAFDTLMILRAKYHGWRVESFEDVRYYQTRTWRRVKLARWILSGRSRYYLGFPVWHTFLIAFVYARQKPLIYGSFSMFLAHLLTRLGAAFGAVAKRPYEDGFYRFVGRYAVAEMMERVNARSVF